MRNFPMDELIANAKKFLDENLGFNEIELSDAKCNKVRLVRCTPTSTTVYSYPYQFTSPGYNPYQPGPY